MRILIVDDSGKKLSAIEATLNEHSDGLPHSVVRADALSDGIRVLNTHPFDLIVLDLMLPYLSGGNPDSRAGLELVNQLRAKASLNRFATVVGISAYPEEVDAFRSVFEEAGVLITKYDESGTWKITLKRVLQDVSERAKAFVNLDFLIVCALDAEREGFFSSSFEKISETVVNGLNVHYGKIGCWFGAIIRLSRMGLVAATREITVALELYRTRVICMTGICAGFSGHAVLGQLVVASPAWEYQAGKWSSNGFEIAPDQVPLRPITRAVIDMTIGSDGFRNCLESDLPKGVVRPGLQAPAVLAPFATGSAVIADTNRLAHIELQHRKLAALDMETYGLYYAAHESINSVEHYFAIKAVVDLADGNKNDNLHPYGCIISARAAERLIDALLRAERPLVAQ